VRIRAEGLVVRYPRSRAPALRGVTFGVEPGTLYAVLGPNGSGKSTLIRALMGSTPLEAGTVTWEGRSLSAWNRGELARAVGVVTQQEAITFPISVRELVGMGRYPHLGPFRPEGEEDLAAVRDALVRCDATELADRDVGTLSGGEFQRVRVARGLAQRPRALVLDEPTASLDIRHEMEILHLLRRSADAGMTVVLITHHLELAARFADRFLLLDEGRVAAEGTLEEVFREDVLERVYAWRIGVARDPVTGYLRVTPLSGDPG